jgi:hypothetical protein
LITTTLKSSKAFREAAFDYLEIFYNRKRLHSTLGYKIPKEVEVPHGRIVENHSSTIKGSPHSTATEFCLLIYKIFSNLAYNPLAVNREAGSITYHLHHWSRMLRNSNSLAMGESIMYNTNLRSIKGGGRRKYRGQALVEHTAAMFLFLPLIFLTIMFIVNVYAVITWQTKLDIVAREAVTVMRVKKYWLDSVQRADYVEEDAKEQAQSMANSVRRTLGLNAIAPITFKETPTEAGDLLHVTVSFSGKQDLPFGGASFLGITAFPAAVTLKGHGVACIPKTSLYSYASIAAPAPGAPGKCILAHVPALGFSYITATTPATWLGPVPGLPYIDTSTLSNSTGGAGFGAPSPAFSWMAACRDGSDSRQGFSAFQY